MLSEPRVPMSLLSYRKHREKREMAYQEETREISPLHDVLAAWAVAVGFLFGLMALSLF